MSEIVARDPRVEAQALLPDGYEARVLEPSPPANTDPDWYADDPTAVDGSTGTVVTPIDGEGIAWEQAVDDRAGAESFLADHWLGFRRRLGPLPDGYDETRRGLHQIAFFAIAPKRHTETGKLGLRYTYRGFGTPFFGADEQVRVDRGVLVYQKGAEVSSAPLTTVGEACEFLGITYNEEWFADFHDPLEPVGSDVVLAVDERAALAIADWFGFATFVLETARRTPGAEDVSRVQLWPEHFDPAIEMGSYEMGQRASFGASPGDEAYPEPYLYVSAWGDVDRSDPFWNSTSFNGALLSFSDLLASDDQVGAALEFFRHGHQRLTGS